MSANDDPAASQRAPGVLIPRPAPQASPGDGPGDALDRLLEGAPGEVLRRLTDGDPLRLEERTARWLRKRALLLDLARTASTTATEIARRAHRLRSGSTADCIAACLEAAVAALLREDRAEEAASLPCELGDPRYEFMTQTFAIEPAGARRAAVTFNGLPLSSRRAFFLLVMEGLDLDTARARDQAAGGSPEDLQKRVSCALRALLDPDAVLAELASPRTDQEAGA